MITKYFDQVFTFEELYRAHMRGRKAKRDKKPLVKFELHTLENLYNVYVKLNNGSYKIRGYNSFVVYEPKRREIQTVHYYDRVVLHVLCDNVLLPYFTKRAITDNCVCQKGKGTLFALQRFEKSLREYVRKKGTGVYILKCDILKYFHTIPHPQLKKIICSLIADERLKKLVEDIIDSFHSSPVYLESCGVEPLVKGSRQTGRGVPIGNQTSQVFGMYYLNEVDRYVKETLRLKVYSRYMDDFVLVHESKEFLQKALVDIGKIIERLGLKFNSKTQIYPLKNGVTYLGFRFSVTPTGKIVKTVKKKTKLRMRWRVKLLKKAYYDGAIGSERVSQSLAAMRGHLKHSDNFKLRKELSLKLADIVSPAAIRLMLYGKKQILTKYNKNQSKEPISIKQRNEQNPLKSDVTEIPCGWYNAQHYLTKFND